MLSKNEMTKLITTSAMQWLQGNTSPASVDRAIRLAHGVVVQASTYVDSIPTALPPPPTQGGQWRVPPETAVAALALTAEEIILLRDYVQNPPSADESPAQEAIRFKIFDKLRVLK